MPTSSLHRRRSRRQCIHALLAASALNLAAISAPCGAQPIPPSATPPAASARPAAPSLPVPPGIFGRRDPALPLASDLPAPRRFVTRHAMTLAGRPFAYRATAAETYISNIEGRPVASIFSFDYVREGVADQNRPVAFIFNGGPGSASLWLHMGIVGPKRVVLSPELNSRNVPPFGLADNPDTLLAVADLVFIDPVGTGFSHAVGGARDLDFAGLDVDAEATARFIEAWLTHNGRWNAPKYLVGESYGTTRAAVLPRALMGGPLYNGIARGITVDGVVLIGSSLNAGRAVPAAADDPRAAEGAALAALATTAWYHQRAPRAARSVAQVYADARAYGETTYAAALFGQRAGTLTPQDRRAVAERLAGFTGIAADEWERRKLEMSPQAYLKLVAAPQGLEAGAYDSRYTLPLAQSGGDPVADDPAMGRYVPGFVAAFHMLLHDELKVNMPFPYAAIQFGDLNAGWDWRRTGIPADRWVGDDLATAMRRNPDMRVMVASGYYDMVTTAASAEQQVRDAALPSGRTLIRNYESGHMLYLGGTAPLFAADLRAFVAARRDRPAGPAKSASH